MSSPQRTPDWKEGRRALFTASNTHKLMGKKGLGATGETYIETQAAELVSGVCIETAETFAMRQGTEREPIAARIYARNEGLLLIETGFTRTPKVYGAGVSPDRLSTDGRFGTEIKCPGITSHFRYLGVQTAQNLLDVNPANFWQVQHCLLTFPDTQWWDFVSYCPEYGPQLALWIAEIERVPWAQEMLLERLGAALLMRNDMARPVVETGRVNPNFLINKDYF